MNIARPLSVRLIVKKYRSKLCRMFPLFAKGMNSDTESGKRKTIKTLFRYKNKGGLNRMAATIPSKRYKSRI